MIDNDDLDHRQICDIAIYRFRDQLRQGICQDALEATERWADPDLFDQVDVAVISALVDIVTLCNNSTTIVYRALQLIQAHLSSNMENLNQFLDLLPSSMKLSLLSTLCVAVEPRFRIRKLLFASVNQHLDLVAESMPSQESLEIVRYYIYNSYDNAMESAMSSTLIQNGIWRQLCSSWKESQLHTESVIAGLQSVQLANYFSRANIRMVDDFKCPGGIAIVIVLSLCATHQVETWTELGSACFSDLISDGFLNPNRLISVLDMIPPFEPFRASCYADSLRNLQSSIVANEGGPDTKTAKRLNRIIRSKLQTSIKAD